MAFDVACVDGDVEAHAASITNNNQAPLRMRITTVRFATSFVIASDYTRVLSTMYPVSERLRSHVAHSSRLLQRSLRFLNDEPTAMRIVVPEIFMKIFPLAHRS